MPTFFRSSARRMLWLLMLAVPAMLLILSACAGGTYGYVIVNGTRVLITLPPSAGVGGESTALSNLYYAERTREAAALELTNAAVSATQVAVATNSAVQLTQVEFNRQLASDAATSTTQALIAGSTATQAWMNTQDMRTAAAATLTQARSFAQDTATAQVATETHGTLVAVAAVTASVLETQSSAAVTATAVQAGINQQTQVVTTWGPILFIILLAGSALAFAWRIMGIFEARKRVIPQPNGAPLIIAEQRASLETYLPNFLRWLAWFVETRQVIVDQEKHMYPITVIAGGTAQAPRFTDDDRQERVTRRRQFVQAVQALASGSDEIADAAQVLASGSASAALPGGSEVVEAEYRIEKPDKFKDWLSEVRQQLPAGGDFPAESLAEEDAA